MEHSNDLGSVIEKIARHDFRERDLGGRLKYKKIGKRDYRITKKEQLNIRINGR